MKGGPGAWGRGAAERRSLQWPWVSVGEFPLRPSPIYAQPSIVLHEWMSGSGGPTYSRTGLGGKLDFGIAGVLAWCGESSNDTHVGLTRAARVDKFTLVPRWRCMRLQSLSQSGHSRMLIDQSWPCIGSARLRTAWHPCSQDRGVPGPSRVYSCRTRAGCKGGQIHSADGDGA